MDTQTPTNPAAARLAALRLALTATEATSPNITPLSAPECDALNDDHLVCQCNNVSAGEIRGLIKCGKANSVDDVQVITRAGGGCGNCIPMVHGLVKTELDKK